MTAVNDQKAGLANLSPAEPGNVRAVTHGAHSERLIGPIASDVSAGVEALCAGTPAGEPQFAAARAVLARKLARLRMVGEYLESNHDGSPLTHKGGVLKAAQFELSLLASVEKSLTDLGLNPGAAAKLGVELVRGSSIAEELAAARQVRDRADQTHSPTQQTRNADSEVHP
jgi:hypothetical protein